MGILKGLGRSLRQHFCKESSQETTTPTLSEKKISDLLSSAYQHYESGQITQAQALYATILKSAPFNSDANYFMGVILGQTGNFIVAIEHLESSLNINPNSYEARNALGNTYNLSNNFQDAITNYQESLNLNPNQSMPHYNLGMCYHSTEKPKEAIKHFNQALALQPENVPALNALSTALIASGQFKESISCINRALQLEPKSAKLLTTLGLTQAAQENNTNAQNSFSKAIKSDPTYIESYLALAELLRKKGKLVKAKETYEQALDIDYESHQAHYGLGIAHYDTNEITDALDCFQLALHHNNRHVPSLFALGKLYKKQGELSQAEDYFQQTLNHDPNFFPAMLRLGVLLQKKGNFSTAKELFKKYVELCPESEAPIGLNNMALIDRELGHYDNAVKKLKKALAIEPNYIEALSHLGLTLYDQGKPDEAIICYNTALKKAPGFEEAIWNRSTALLSLGKYHEGWKDYKYRWRPNSNIRHRPFTYPPWNNTCIKDGELLIYGEQGLGDEIMFSSCIPDSMKMHPNLIIECDKKLEPLFKRSFVDATVHGRKHPDDITWLKTHQSIKAQIPIGSLPSLYRNNQTDFPQRSHYLKADPKRIEFWKSTLSKKFGNTLKIGISWRGGTSSTRALLRSIDIMKLTPIFKDNPFSFINLQYDDIDKDLYKLKETENITIHNFPDAIADYDETAALVSALDLVISVQTAIIHLCGALGTTAWVMVPFSAEWRYQYTGKKIPWYSSVELFRQQSPDNWEGVVDQIKYRLDNYKN